MTFTRILILMRTLIEGLEQNKALFTIVFFAYNIVIYCDEKDIAIFDNFKQNVNICQPR
jgi:hypothetical protein